MSMGTLLLSWLCLTTSATPIDVFPINNRNFQIPIHIDPARKTEIKQLVLFYSSDQGKSWQQAMTAAPEKEAFQFYAPSDGLYWFSVVVVDFQGNRTPDDINKAPPAQKILVDTEKPVVRIVSAERQGNDVLVAWDIQEDHPDLATLKLEYRTPDAPPNQWYTAPLIQASSGQTKFPVNSPGTVLIRMQVQDQAQNIGTATSEVSTGGGASSNYGVASSGGLTNPPAGGVAPASLTSSGPAGASWEGHAGHPDLTLPSEPPAPGMVAASLGGKQLVASSDTPPRPTLTPRATPSLHPGPGTMPPVEYVNSLQIPIDYQVEGVGPSGVGKVELWMTQDDGHKWQLLTTDPDLKPPVVAELPGEGVYGFYLVVTSRAGLGEPAPKAGDPPQMRVEVDLTKPNVQVYTPEPDAQRRDALVISWRVTDRNLDANPITIQWAERHDGPWETIGSELPNTGRFSWQLPPNVPIRVYLRLVAHDKAGNVSEAVTQEPITVDLSTPKGVLKGIAGLTHIREP